MPIPYNQRLILCQREVNLWCWGESGRPLILLWHGFARQGRDFDVLAHSLSDSYYLVCPDTIGRGLSQWSPLPALEYNLEFYLAQAKRLLKELGYSQCIWIGTSMGGLMGMLFAHRYWKQVKKLVINDVGPEIDNLQVYNLLVQAGLQPAFDTMAKLEAYLRQAYADFGQLSDQQWQEFSRHSARRRDDGMFTLHHDPKIANPLFQLPLKSDLWEAFGKLEIPALVLRGQRSSLLSPETYARMQAQQPGFVYCQFSGCGHAPYLNTKEQIEVIKKFL